jgi:putative ABC transport system permease protein
MSLFEPVKMAFSSIWAHKARSFLTMLGIIIGVSSVVSLMSIGEGVKKDVSSEIEGLGSNLLIIVAGQIEGESGGFGQSANMISGDILKKSDVEAVEKVAGVEKAAPIALMGGVLVYENQHFANLMSIATTNEAEGITNFEIDKGDYLKINDKRNVIVLGATSKEEIFGQKNAIGKKVTFNNEEYQVIGVLKKIGSSDIFSDQSFDSMVIFPFAKAEQVAGKADIFRIIVKIKEGYDIKEVTDQVKEKVLASHDGKEDFSVLTQDDLLDLLNSIFNMLTALVSAIASISLVVGGIGIMNIMLVSVTERTREIGLRKAVGATPIDILRQFLIEAVIITLLGGAIGVLFSYAATSIVRKYSVLDPSITLYAIVLAAGISIGVGIIFGLAPAISAARKNPIDALRYE